MTTTTTENYEYGEHMWRIQTSSSKTSDWVLVEGACPVCGYRKKVNASEKVAMEKFKQWIHRHFESCRP